MAEILDQKTIDELLRDMSRYEEKEPTEKTTTEKLTSRIRIIRPVNKRKTRFDYLYNSPVIKKEDCVFNPPSDFEEGENTYVVRSVGNFNKYKAFIKSYNKHEHN